MAARTITSRTWAASRFPIPAGEPIPRGRCLRVAFTVILPNAATKADVMEWLSLHLGCGGMANDNPLARFDVEGRRVEVTDTGLESDYLDARDEALESAVKALAPIPAETKGQPSAGSPSSFAKASEDKQTAPTEGPKE